ncbi:hypothetical protein ACIQOW_08335 [Kitasatospora sp. NPDC091335]|uniref:hypothetical protein n=1 Tax=Kitasatospora sp. NPDC091335 TaxID=3364085 RepID=UPI00381D3E12
MSYTLTAEGLVDPSTHTTLAAAVVALRGLLDDLPLDPGQARAYDFFLTGEAGVRRVQDYLDQDDGRFALDVLVSGHSYTAVIAVTSSG